MDARHNLCNVWQFICCNNVFSFVKIQSLWLHSHGAQYSSSIFIINSWGFLNGVGRGWWASEVVLTRLFRNYNPGGFHLVFVSVVLQSVWGVNSCSPKCNTHSKLRGYHGIRCVQGKKVRRWRGTINGCLSLWEDSSMSFNLSDSLDMVHTDEQR